MQEYPADGAPDRRIGRIPLHSDAPMAPRAIRRPTLRQPSSSETTSSTGTEPIVVRKTVSRATTSAVS